MIDSLAHLFTVIFGWPIVAMIGAMVAWAFIDAFLTALLFPWRNRS